MNSKHHDCTVKSMIEVIRAIFLEYDCTNSAIISFHFRVAF